MNVLKFLENNVKPATGCTEPIAVGYAVSLAYHALFNDLPKDFGVECPEPEYEKIRTISVKTDRDVYKNALAITIPGTNGQKGMVIAAAMGLYCHPSEELNLFAGVTQEVIQKSNQLLDGGKIILEEVDDTAERSELDIQVIFEYLIDSVPKKAYTRLQYEHNNIRQIKVDGNLVYEGRGGKTTKLSEELPNTLGGLIGIVRELTDEEKNKVYEGIEMNKRIAEEGLKSDYGLRNGKQLQALVEQGALSNSLITEVRIKAAAAGDARMGGANMPVMSTAGSGNQGITALIPILVIGERKGMERDKMSEAAMLSHLVTKYVSNYSGYLSAICGCAIKAGMGATAGVTYLLGGNIKQINNAINIMAANVTGMICDGAKESCALKLSTAAGTATESAIMALNSMEVPSDNGIINKRAEITMVNIGKIAKAMVPTDIEIVRIMQNNK